MRINILSCFRNSAGQHIEDYFYRIDKLEKVLGNIELRLILGYGDSTDGTGEELYEICSHRFATHLIEVSHGGKIYGSIENEDRFKNLSFVGNKLLQHLRGLHHGRDDYVILMESDIIWKAVTILGLLKHLEKQSSKNIIVAPMIMEDQYPSVFYDVFAFRKKGVRFTKKYPFHPDLWDKPFDLIELDSAGSFLVGRTDPFLTFRFPEEGSAGAIVGFCNNIVQGGGQILLDKYSKVYHP